VPSRQFHRYDIPNRAVLGLASLCAGVDEDAIAGPMKWDGKFIERLLFGAGEALFQTGRFMEPITTQVLVVFAIRTRRPIFRSGLHVLLAAVMALRVIAVAIALPLFPVSRWLGFVVPSPLFFVFLIGATSAYLAIVEINKRIFRRTTVERPS